MKNKGRFLPGKRFDKGVQLAAVVGWGGTKGRFQYELTLGAMEVKGGGGGTEAAMNRAYHTHAHRGNLQGILCPVSGESWLSPAAWRAA